MRELESGSSRCHSEEPARCSCAPAEGKQRGRGADRQQDNCARILPDQCCMHDDFEQAADNCACSQMPPQQIQPCPRDLGCTLRAPSQLLSSLLTSLATCPDGMPVLPLPPVGPAPLPPLPCRGGKVPAAGGTSGKRTQCLAMPQAPTKRARLTHMPHAVAIQPAVNAPRACMLEAEPSTPTAPAHRCTLKALLAGRLPLLLHLGGIGLHLQVEEGMMKGTGRKGSSATLQQAPNTSFRCNRPAAGQ